MQRFDTAAFRTIRSDSGIVTELHANDLRFTPEEGVAFLNQVPTVLGWLSALPDGLVRARPLLCTIHAPDGATTLEGSIRDQSALYGLIDKARDLGLTLVCVIPCPPLVPTEVAT